MRASLILTVLAVVFAPETSFALQASDTMVAWQNASAEEKAKLVGELLQKNGGSSSAGVIACLDSASSVAGHADLPIAAVAKACQENIGDPV